MRISDWSSDVCSSDLGVSAQAYDRLLQGKARPGDVKLAQGVGFNDPTGGDVAGNAAGGGGGVEKAAGGRTKLADASAEATKRERERSEEHTSELQSLMRISYAVFYLKKKTN